MMEAYIWAFRASGKRFKLPNDSATCRQTLEELIVTIIKRKPAIALFIHPNDRSKRFGTVPNCPDDTIALNWLNA